MDSDTIVGTVGGLLALGIVANVAGNMINNKRRSLKKQKGLSKSKGRKSIW